MVYLVPHRAPKEETYRDMARIPEKFRLDQFGKPIAEGQICEVTLNRQGGDSAYVIVRGMSVSDDTPYIQLDEVTRGRLGVTEADLDAKKGLPFLLDKTGTVGQVLFAWGASDPAYRVLARVAVLSAVLTIIAVVIAAVSIILIVH